ncbi:MAG: hypothetical protein KDC54_03635 [Lewinella sp.]|nr:hypothetical protein [Lewinella sp.]
MKHCFILFGFFLAVTTLAAQKGDPLPDPFMKRTFPIDSCLYFQLPTDIIIAGTRSFGGGGLGVVTNLSFSTSDGNDFLGRGKFIINPETFPVPGQTWEAGQTGQLLLVVPDNALAAALGEPGTDLIFPILLNAFLRRIDDTEFGPPIPIHLQLQELEGF